MDNKFHVFLCHNSKDKPTVRKIYDELCKRNIKPWLDELSIRPGDVWQFILEEQIKSIETVAVCFGETGIGLWQQEEIYAFLIQRCRVIPVILKNASKELEMPVFLKSRHYVDFRLEDPNPINELIWGITGNKVEEVHNTELLNQNKSSICEEPEGFHEASLSQENESIEQEEQSNKKSENLSDIDSTCYSQDEYSISEEADNLCEASLNQGIGSIEQEEQGNQSPANLNSITEEILPCHIPSRQIGQMEKPQIYRKRRLKYIDSNVYERMIKTIDGDDLISERGVDYRSLQRTLQEAMWREADLETHKLISNAMFKESRESSQGLFREELIEFPCADLATLDRLWTRYSHRRFGFSIQKSIWEKHGCPTKMSENWNKFCIEIGWKNPMNTRYLDYVELKMNPLISPAGELPSGLYFFRSLFGGFFIKKFQIEIDGCDLFCRVGECGL